MKTSKEREKGGGASLPTEAVTTQARELLLLLRKYMRMFLQAEKDCMAMRMSIEPWDVI